VLSRIFGQAVGDSTRQLSGGGLNAHQTDRMIQDVIDLSDDA